jgi:hypothetical protein
MRRFGGGPDAIPRLSRCRPWLNALGLRAAPGLPDKASKFLQLSPENGHLAFKFSVFGKGDPAQD